MLTDQIRSAKMIFSGFSGVCSTDSQRTSGHQPSTKHNGRCLRTSQSTLIKHFLRLALAVIALWSYPALAQIPAIDAFNGPPGCSDVDLSQQSPPDVARITPEWKPILLDTLPPNNPPSILEGFVAATPATEDSSSQAKAEVSEEEIPWNHMTHDFT